MLNQNQPKEPILFISWIMGGLVLNRTLNLNISAPRQNIKIRVKIFEPFK